MSIDQLKAVAKTEQRDLRAAQSTKEGPTTPGQ
jgi:hypothetical protein